MTFRCYDVCFWSDSKTISLQLVSPEISGIPIGMSYSCAEKIYLISNDTTPGKRMAIEMEGVQVMSLIAFSNSPPSSVIMIYHCAVPHV